MNRLTSFPHLLVPSSPLATLLTEASFKDEHQIMACHCFKLTNNFPLLKIQTPRHCPVGPAKNGLLPASAGPPLPL